VPYYSRKINVDPINIFNWFKIGFENRVFGNFFALKLKQIFQILVSL